MLHKTEQDVPISSEKVHVEVPTNENDKPKHKKALSEDIKRVSKIRFKLDDSPSPQFNSLVSNSKSDRSHDMVNVDDLQVNPKTFMSFADPEQLM